MGRQWFESVEHVTTLSSRKWEVPIHHSLLTLRFSARFRRARKVKMCKACLTWLIVERSTGQVLSFGIPGRIFVVPAKSVQKQLQWRGSGRSSDDHVAGIQWLVAGLVLLLTIGVTILGDPAPRAGHEAGARNGRIPPFAPGASLACSSCMVRLNHPVVMIVTAFCLDKNKRMTFGPAPNRHLALRDSTAAP